MNSGYDQERFVGTVVDEFQCIICMLIAKQPYECQGCGRLYCKLCTLDWSKKNPNQICANRCSINKVTPIFSKALQKMYNNLDIKCSNQKCNKTIKLMDLQKHESFCLLPKCWNFDICEKPLDKAIKSTKNCCSQLCQTVNVLNEKFNNKPAMYEALSKYFRNNLSYGGNSPTSFNKSSTNTGGSGSLTWDSKKSGTGIQFTDGNCHAFLKEQSYLFRTCLGSIGWSSGVHYWEIIADNRTENELKIGVATSKQFDFNSAFCDHPFGYAYYGLGQLRHNSNASGSAFGKRFKKEGTLGICLNMNKGTLSFALNGEYMGVAFKDDKLKNGPIYPAVALLHHAGCKIKLGLMVPSIFKD